MYTISPPLILKGDTEKPFSPDGVVIKHVKIPVEFDSTLLMLIPLVLLIANTFAESSGIPVGFSKISTVEIDALFKFALSYPLFIFLPLIESTIIKSGSLV